MRSPGSALLLVLFVGVTPATALAQVRDPAAAEALFAQGREAMKRGDYEAACAKFRESDLLDPTATGTLLNLAECEEKEGRLASSWQHLRQALDALAPSDDRVEYARAHLAAIEPRVPKLIVRVAPSAPPTAHVARAMVEVGPASLGAPLPVDPGPQEILVSAPGYETRRYTVELHEGEVKEIQADVGVPVLPSPSAGRSPWRTAGFVTVGIGAAALGIGGVMGALAIGRNDYMNAHCSPGRVNCSPEAVAAGSAGRTYADISTVSFLAGAVLVAAGTYLVLSHGKKAGVRSAGAAW
jgi:hypothetical protein